MNELLAFGELVNKIGVPVLFFLVLIYLLFKGFPEWLKSQEKKQEAQRAREEANQKYYAERNQSYNDQMQIISRIAEQGNQMIGQATAVISQSNEVIRMNTETIKNNTEVHKEVREALGRDIETLKSFHSDFKEHDKRSHEMQTTMERVMDRLE